MKEKTTKTGKKGAVKKSKVKSKKKIKEEKPIEILTDKDNESKAIEPVKEKQSISIVTEKTINDFLFGSDSKLSDQQKTLFMQTCVLFQLNPFKREAYAIPFKNTYGQVKMNIITGYEVYLKRADRSGKLDGWKAWTEGKKGEDLRACIEIKRKDFSDPFYHEVYFVEYDQKNKMWQGKPYTMIKKVVMAQGFRLAFPDELGGMPYTSDEMPLTDDNIKTISEKSETEKPKEEKKEDVKKPQVIWTEGQEAVMEDIRIGCKILDWNGEQFKEKYKIKMIKLLTKDQLKEILRDINIQIDALEKENLKYDTKEKENVE